MSVYLIVFVLVILLANLAVSSVSLYSANSTKEKFVQGTQDNLVYTGYTSQDNLVYTGYTSQDKWNSCIGKQGNNCASEDCKQGDGYCFCMVKCGGSNGIVLGGDCSSGIPFDPSSICSSFGGNPSPL